jgi:hypothetical protein
MASLLRRLFSSEDQRARQADAPVTDATSYAPVSRGDDDFQLTAGVTTVDTVECAPTLKLDLDEGQEIELIDESQPLATRISHELLVQLRSSLPIVLTLGFEFLPGTISEYALGLMYY